MQPGVNEPCPCGSGRKFKKCCRRWLGTPRAPSPEALLRSRYTAYAVGDVDHLLATTHPDGPHARADRAAWRDELAAYCAAVTPVALTVHDHGVEGDAGWVTFEAVMEGPDGRFVLTERSRFLHEAGAGWRYLDGEVSSAAP